MSDQTTLSVPVPPAGVLAHLDACIKAAAAQFGDEAADFVAKDWLAKVRKAREEWEAAINAE